MPVAERFRLILFCLPLGLIGTLPVHAEELDPAGLELFEKKIRPALVTHCAECHSAAAEQVQGGLRIDSRAALLAGGDSGAALAPGDPAGSRLLEALRYDNAAYQMPPDGKLSDALIADFAQWIKLGAPTPVDFETPTPERIADAIDLEAGRKFWAFQLVAAHDPPITPEDNWSQGPLDRFLLARLQAAQLTPAPRADKYTLIRRAYFDLWGLPPSPEEIEAFVADSSPDAFARLVDRLLASPRYGERWGRHWLDLVRYADTSGADENHVMPEAWRYRDYVIGAFNRDLPYDQFIVEQLAGDLLPPTDDEQTANDRLVATGLLVIGPKMLAEQDKPKLLSDVVDEQIDVVSKTFLGLTVGCARCHDHKFDPIPTHDYYALAGVFMSTKTMGHLNHVSQWNTRNLISAEHAAARAAYQPTLDKIEADIQAVDAQLAADAKNSMLLERKKELEESLKKAREQAPKPPQAMGVEEGTVRDLPVHIRGSHLNLASELVPRGGLQVCDAALPAPEIKADRSGRLELARWIADPRNPLTARVMVNRLWQGHFGVGLVASSSNFGTRGDPPTHPELLDWLAHQFVNEKWSIKAMHRLMLNSAAYQMASTYDPDAAQIDSENRLFWRQNRRRLEAEPIRDTLFAVAGTLRQIEEERITQDPRNSSDARPCRTVYLPVNRSNLHDVLTVFDYSDAGVHVERRSTTTTPQQALFLMNSPVAMEQSRHLAQRLLDSPDINDAQRLEQLYLMLFARPPQTGEIELAEAFLRESSSPAELIAAWTSLCRTLLTTNEFLFVD